MARGKEEKDMIHKFVLEVDLDEVKEKERQEFDREMGEGACMKDFISSIEDYIADMLPIGIDIKIRQE